MTLMTKMQISDLAALAKNRNVPEAVRRHALRLAKRPHRQQIEKNSLSHLWNSEALR